MTGFQVVYHSFYGRYSDNPRAVFEALQHRLDASHVWLAHPAHQDGFPVGVATVPVDSAAGQEALESADLLVSNTHVEADWHKAPHTTYLQTWHGTPLKRIHHDVLWAPPGRLSRLDEDVADWDVLLSPNAPSTPRLRQAFRYDREVLETGYPRNDALRSVDRDNLRHAGRHALGIVDDVVAVLYAPTWRDDEVFTEDRRGVPMALDLERCVERLGAGYRILARPHSAMTGRSVPPAVPGVINVSYYPDITDLYLAADVLVTDYSSAMFDFALTGRPIVFYAYDMERYRDSIRGFYFDLFPYAPGPVVLTVDDLVAALRDLPGLAREFAAPYERFATTYGHLEDGHATERVLERLGLLAPVTAH